ncbi:MAG TPA: MFS transporter [Opitutaceae bacterium]|nr:MFS transporter [Opitutaceae bacterium]
MSVTPVSCLLTSFRSPPDDKLSQLHRVRWIPAFRFGPAVVSSHVPTMKDLLRDTRVQRLIAANTLGSIGSGVTIFSVPWLMVHQPGGNDAYRWVTIATTLVLFAILPQYGALVDRHSRKAAILASELWGLIATSSMAVLGLVLGRFGMVQLMAIYFCGMLYYTLHYPAKFAMIQQMFDRSQYQSLTGLIEVQGQTAMMIAGGLGGYLVDHVPLWVILLFDASTYLFSFLVLSTLPYDATHLETARKSGVSATGAAAPRPGVWQSVIVGWNWLRERPRLTVFLTCSLIPFIIIMAANYLIPIYVAETLHASAVYFAGGEITFAVGAIVAGALLPWLVSRHTAAATIPATMFVFLAGLVLVIVFHVPATFIAANALLGFGNAGCRVARNALMLHIIPVEVMGRVSGFYNVLDRVLRTLFVMAMGIVDFYGPPAGFVVLAILLVISLYGVLNTRSTLSTYAAEPVAA